MQSNLNPNILNAHLQIQKIAGKEYNITPTNKVEVKVMLEYLRVVQGEKIYDPLLNGFSERKELLHRFGKYQNYLVTPDGQTVLKIIKFMRRSYLDQKLGLMMECSLNLNISDNIRSNVKAYKAHQNIIDFMVEQLNGYDMKQIFEQGRKYPIIHAAVKELAATYSQWDLNLNKEDLNHLKSLIDTQHKNLFALSDLFKKFENSGQERNLMELVLLPYKLESPFINEVVLSPFLKGKKTLDGQNRLFIEKLMTKAFMQMNSNNYVEGSKKGKESPNGVDSKSLESKESTDSLNNSSSSESLDIKELKLKRNGSSVSKIAIRKQAQLFNAERKVKLSLSDSDESPKRIGNKSKNLVLEIKKINKIDPLKTSSLAFFKEGSQGEAASAIMEKLMWDLAMIMGFEDIFTPTKTLNLELPLDSNDANQNSPPEAHFGGLQPTQQGHLLYDVIEDPNLNIDIRQSQLVKATLATIVFGMFDAHGENILVNRRGNLFLFDNARSMPTSNGVILRDAEVGQIFSSYMSSLMCLPGNLKPFNKRGRNDLLVFVQKCRLKIIELEKFLNLPITKAQLDSLPYGWWNQEKSIVALKERIDNLEKAISTPEVNNLRDLVFASNLDFKFFAVLETFFFYTLNDPNPISKVLKGTGNKAMISIMEKMPELGMDITKIFALCQHHSLTYEDILNIVIQEYEKIKALPITEEDMNKNKQAVKAVVDHYIEKAEVDLKDMDKENIPMAILFALKHKYKLDIIFLKEEQIVHNLNNLPAPAYILQRGNRGIEAPRLTIYYSNSNGEIKKAEISYMVKEKFLQIDELLFTPQELKDVCIPPKNGELSPLQKKLRIF